MKKKTEDNIAEYPIHIETRVALLEQSIGHINDTLIRIEKRFDKIDIQFNDVRKEFKDIRKEMKSDFRCLFGLNVGLSAFTVAGLTGLLGIMAHGFHWI